MHPTADTSVFINNRGARRWLMPGVRCFYFRGVKAERWDMPARVSKAPLLGLCALSSLLVSGCSFSSRSYSPGCWDFTNLTPEQQRADFQKQPMEKQLDLYLCKMSEEPPDSSYADPIADRGPEAIPIIIAKMKKVDDTDKGRLLYIMEAMSDRGHLWHRADVYAELSQLVDAMNPMTRQRCEERLKKIAINSRVKQFTYTSP
jgi:hypothetical protein